MIIRPIPIVFEPIFKPRPWGGRRLERLLGKRLPAGQPIGESWDLADLPGDESRVRGGPLAGRTLSELIALWGADLVGRAPLVDGRFPLLVKFLDARENLSVQVHPSRAANPGLPAAGLKDEAWFVIDAEPGASIYAGARAGATRADFEKACGSPATVALLRRWPATAGQCYFLPSGTPHALGAGVMVAEVQTPSDVTYRMYDWGRVGLDGRSRELHVRQALESVRLDVADQQILRTDPTRLAECEHFRIDRLRPPRHAHQPLAAGEPLVWIVLKGSGRLVSADAELALAGGEVILVPAAARATCAISEDADILEVRLSSGATTPMECRPSAQG